MVAVAAALTKVLHLTNPAATASFTLPAAAAAAQAADGMTAIPHLQAADFHLLDQSGRPISLSQFRGKTVVLTFLDPVCWYQCPLQAQDMRLMLDYLPKSARANVALVAVAANPVVHSLASIRAFDREQGLTHLPNWYFLTSGSVSALKNVWQRYYVDVSVPRDGMVDHGQIFYLIAPNGQVRYLSNPTDQASGFVGTAELLAAYTSRILGVHPEFRHAGPEVKVLSHLPYAPGFDPSTIPTKPVMVSSDQGWKLADQGGHEILLTTRNGGKSWRNVSPPGVSKRGGLAVSFGSGGQAWAIIRPYGYNLVPVAFYTDDWGRNWITTDLLASRSLLAAMTEPLASSGNTAYLLTDQGLWHAKGAGAWTRLTRALPPKIPAEGVLSITGSGRIEVTGQSPGHAPSFAWTATDGWQRM